MTPPTQSKELRDKLLEELKVFHLEMLDPTGTTYKKLMNNYAHQILNTLVDHIIGLEVMQEEPELLTTDYDTATNPIKPIIEARRTRNSFRHSIKASLEELRK